MDVNLSEAQRLWMCSEFLSWTAGFYFIYFLENLVESKLSKRIIIPLRLDAKYRDYNLESQCHGIILKVYAQ